MRETDRSTPLYKARFEALPVQSQQVMDALAIHWDPISAGELAVLVRLEQNVVSSQLNRLEKQGLVEKVAYHPSSKAGYQVSERFFNIWYLMRASRRVRQRLIWLVEFLKLLYGPAQLEQHADRHLRAGLGPDTESKLRHAEFGFALAQVVGPAPLRSALESDAMRALFIDKKLQKNISMLVDLEGADASLKSTAERHAAIAEIKEAIASADVKWGELSRERFTEILVSEPFTNLAVKRMSARWLSKKSAEQIKPLVSAIERNLEEFRRSIGNDTTFTKFCEAAQQGFLEDIFDVDGAQAAAIYFEDPDLPAIALACRLRNKKRTKRRSRA